MRIAVRIYAFAFDIPRANVDVAGFSTKTPFRSACRTVYYICLPAYVASDGPLTKTRHCRACNGGIRVLPGVLATFPGELPGGIPGVLAAKILPS